MDPVTALRQIAFYKDRAGDDVRRVMAYRKAADIVAARDPGELRLHRRGHPHRVDGGLGERRRRGRLERAARDPVAVVGDHVEAVGRRVDRVDEELRRAHARERAQEAAALTVGLERIDGVDPQPGEDHALAGIP